MADPATGRKARNRPPESADGVDGPADDGELWHEAEAALSLRAANTRRAYASTLRGFRHSLRARPPTAELARGYLLGMARAGAEPSSVLRHQAALAWLFRKVLHRQPPEPLEISRREAEPRWLSMEEVERLVAACRTPTERALLLTLASSGCRISEALRLTWEDIHADGFLRVWGKGGRQRTSPVGDSTIAAIQALPRRRREPRIFGFGYDKARTTLDGLAARARIEHFTPHALRHTCATLSLLEGMDIRDVSEQLGHASLATTRRYTHLLPVDLRRRRVDVIDRAIEKSTQNQNRS